MHPEDPDFLRPCGRAPNQFKNPGPRPGLSSVAPPALQRLPLCLPRRLTSHQPLTPRATQSLGRCDWLYAPGSSRRETRYSIKASRPG